MGKYKVGEELIVVNSELEDNKKLKKKCFLNMKDNFSTFSWSIKIVDVQYTAPEVVVSYKSVLNDEIHKVYSTCKDAENFDTEKVLEKALLKAHLQELVAVSTMRNNNLTKLK